MSSPTVVGRFDLPPEPEPEPEPEPGLLVDPGDKDDNDFIPKAFFILLAAAAVRERWAAGEAGETPLLGESGFATETDETADERGFPVALRHAATKIS